ncbi:MAG: DUF1800 family protein [Limisphaerales bacterium]
MLKPISAARWDYAAAAHLLNRAGFGGPPSEIEALVKLGPEQAIARLVDYADTPDAWPRPDWAKPDPVRAERLKQYREAPEMERRELRQAEQKEQRARAQELVLDWLDRMARTPRPLQEKLVLFWHGHFATSIQKVRDPWLMFRQIELFRSQAAGRWPDLLVAVTRDPAMLVWLDQAQSRKEHPNENYAREVMELFALGEGNYSEKDILETARALTGLTYDRVAQEPQWRPRQHDATPKTVLGRTADFGPDEVIRHIANRPQSAQFIARRLWNFFAADEAPAGILGALAAELERGGREVRPMLKKLFLAEEFYAPAVMGSQVKAPVVWLVMAVRQLQRDLPKLPATAAALRDLGQALLAPPNVKGWDGGISWINTASLTARQRHATLLVLGRDGLPEMAVGGQADRLRRLAAARRQKLGTKAPVDVAVLFTEAERRGPETLLPALQRRFLAMPMRSGLREEIIQALGSKPDDDAVLGAVKAVVTSTDYQLT